MLLLALLCTVPQVHGKARSDSNATNTDEGMCVCVYSLSYSALCARVTFYMNS